MYKDSWKILNKLNGKDILDVLLENRGIVSKRQKKEFLNPMHPYDISPDEVGIDSKELEKAVKRIKLSIKKKEQVIVYGDYDADGVCATAIVWETLHALGSNAIPFIPDRFEDGYGINKKRVASIKKENKNTKLIITVDNGIVAHDAIKEAKRLGIDVIVCDHHTCDKKPNAFAVIHTTKISGSAVAYFMAKCLKPEIFKRDSFVELAAIGTISDQLPLFEVNRSIVKHGLYSLNKTKRIGLKKLMMVSGLLDKEIGTYEVGFLIAPRINASGRLASGMDSLRLLCTKNSKRAERLAITLNSLNMERQDVVESTMKEIEEKLSASLSNVVVLADEKYHEGVIGLIASKIVEKTNRPAIVLAIKGSLAKASARSIKGFNIIEAIRAHEEYIVGGGGHEMAAGFSIKTKKIKVFSEKINVYADNILNPEILKKEIKIDCELPFSYINDKVYNTTKLLEPHGVGNPSPLFVTKAVELVSQNFVGRSSKHLRLVLKKDGLVKEGICFNKDNKIKNKKVNICYRISQNFWNGRESVELIVKDIKYGTKI